MDRRAAKAPPRRPHEACCGREAELFSPPGPRTRGLRQSPREAGRILTVVANQPPVAVASADVTTGTAPLTVNFDSTGSFDPEGSALTFFWDFGDGSPFVTTAAATYTYDTPGDYTAELSVVDDRGQVGRDSILITVVAATNQVPALSPTGVAILALLLVAVSLAKVAPVLERKGM